MPSSKQLIEQHYHRPGLFETIMAKLKDLGIAPDQVSRAHIARVDEFHVRGAAVSKELAGMIALNDAQVLDIGCGIGGPARMLAEEFGCSVTGIDLNPEFIRTARALSRLVGLQDQVNFLVGDAQHLPFTDHSFDVAWTQHVQMNVPNKKQFYSEISRVLKAEGTFLYYDIFKSGSAEPDYPVPWADTPAISFLATPAELELNLKESGFEHGHIIDQTQAGIEFFNALFQHMKQTGPPQLGVNVLIGESTKPKLLNLLQALKEGKLLLQSGICQKHRQGKTTA